MKKWQKNLLIFGSLFIIIVFIPGCWAVTKNITVDNDEIDLRNAITAKVSDEEASYDNMWKILRDKAHVTEEYKNAFDTIFSGIIGGRYDNDQNTFMKWIQESNPEFDSGLYKDLMNSIKIERDAFLTIQRQLIDLKREHDNLLDKFPSSWFIDKDKEKIEIKIISSTHTKEVMETGVDDSELFSK